MDSDVAESFRIILSTDGPVKFGPGSAYPIPEEASEKYGFKCFMAMAIYPQTGSPWHFGIHQCSHVRDWTQEEERLFQEIGRRLADGLSTMLTQRDLQINMKKLEEAQDLAHIGNWELDLRNNRLTCSKEAYRIFEIDPQDFGATYEAFLNCVCSEDREAVDDAYTHSLKTKTPYAIDFRLILPDGRVKYVQQQCETYYDHDRPTRSIGTVQDITDRKLVELNLIKTNSLLNAVIQASPAAIIDLDLEGKVKSIWNPAAEKMLGWTAQEAIGESLPSVPPGKEEEFRFFRDSILSGETLNGVEVTRRKKDGSPIDYSIYGSPLRDEAGNIKGNIAILVDITEKKQAEKKLITYQDLLEELVAERTSELEIAKNKAQQYLDIAGVILVAVDLDRRVSLINQKGCEILGYPANEIIGKDWFDIFIPRSFYQTVMDEFWYPSTVGMKPIDYLENPIVTKDGKERLIAWHNVLLKDARGNITGTLSSGQDITEYKQAENQIISLNKDLIRRARALEDANQELEAFAYSVSHDLRAPLRHIDGFIELLEKRIGTNLNEECRHYVKVISKSAKIMGSLIDDLLAFSRLGRQLMSFDSINLGSMVDDIVRELESDLIQRKIDWQIGNLPIIKGDGPMLRVVLMNLVSNAVKFTQTREQAIVKIGHKYQNTETIVFVSDNGVGFDQAYENKLFGVFQRLHKSEEFEGTGVGLAIAQRIVNRHGGRIWAESIIEKGATFYFSIPTIRQEESNGQL
jgi:PAS domain S-box-containing protein